MLSDCSRCWNTPCSCGWDYRNYDIKRLEKMKSLFESIIQFKKDHPNAQFSSFCMDEKTEDDKLFANFINKL